MRGSPIQIPRIEQAALLAMLAFEFACGLEHNGTNTSDDSGTSGQPDGWSSSEESSGGNEAGSSGGSGSSSGQVAAGISIEDSGASSDATVPADARAGLDSGPDAAAMSSTGTFPAIGDAGAPGPYATSVKSGAGPNGDATVYYPTSFGPNGLKNPIFVWDPGSGIPGTAYATLLTQLASEGFVAYACNASSEAGTEVTDGISWMIAQNTTSESMFFGKLDTTKVAAGGHSLGSLAVFADGTDPRLTTTVHISGGAGGTTATQLIHPAAYLCGETCPAGDDSLTSCDLAAPNCATDYMNTTVPVFYGQNTTASHAFGWEDDFGGITAWLRLQLMGDMAQKPWFLGAHCGLCTTPWIGMSKNW